LADFAGGYSGQPSQSKSSGRQADGLPAEALAKAIGNFYYSLLERDNISTQSDNIHQVSVIIPLTQCFNPHFLQLFSDYGSIPKR
jgi:hypothetical protein